ncbi:hypothetical protein OROGR_000538 [Orobanche gracilis]
MNLLKLNVPTDCHHRHRCRQLNLRPPSKFLVSTSREHFFKLPQSFATPLHSFTKHADIRKVFPATPISIEKIKEEESEDFEEYLAEDGEIYQKTLRLVECAMFAAVSALAYLLSNSLAIERYFACGRKTMVATAVLLFVLSGPVKAITYLLWHGLLGFSMGTLWRLKTSWVTSVFLCLIVRAFGGLCNLVIASYLLGENIPALITTSMHAVVTNRLSDLGIIAVPSMNSIYFIFGFLLMLNCGVSVFFLHLLYAIIFKSFGMKASLRLPKWLEASI